MNWLVFGQICPRSKVKGHWTLVKNANFQRYQENSWMDFVHIWHIDTSWHVDALINFWKNLAKVKGQRSLNFGQKFQFPAISGELFHGFCSYLTSGYYMTCRWTVYFLDKFAQGQGSKVIELWLKMPISRDIRRIFGWILFIFDT